jgi:hypothetical protein
MNMEHLLAATNKVVELNKELTAAREELADWHNAAEQVKAEYPDEVHCSCVAILRKQLKDSTEQRDKLAEALEQWQPIETAPKDRSFILSAHPEHGYLITRWLGAREMWDGWAIEPTHWMSLPKLTTP